MTTYIVSYDLLVPGQKYECLKRKLEAHGTYWRFQQSAWLVRTNASAAQIRDDLNGCLDSNDKLMVAGLSGEAAWSGYTEQDARWLKQTAFA